LKYNESLIRAITANAWNTNDRTDNITLSNSDRKLRIGRPRDPINSDGHLIGRQAVR
jgi:hypothetical protein